MGKEERIEDETAIMTTDRELLVAAAKAAGMEIDWDGNRALVCVMFRGHLPNWHDWNPLADDGDALRLAVALNIPVYPYGDETSTGTVGVVAKNFGSKEENTRRAITRAAAMIGGLG